MFSGAAAPRFVQIRRRPKACAHMPGQLEQAIWKSELIFIFSAMTETGHGIVA